MKCCLSSFFRAASPPSSVPLIHWSIYLWWCDQPLAIRDAVWKLLLSFKYLLPSQANLCLKCVYWFWSACQYLALCYHTPSHLHQLMLRKKREREIWGGGGEQGWITMSYSALIGSIKRADRVCLSSGCISFFPWIWFVYPFAKVPQSLGQVSLAARPHPSLIKRKPHTHTHTYRHKCTHTHCACSSFLAIRIPMCLTARLTAECEGIRGIRGL